MTQSIADYRRSVGEQIRQRLSKLNGIALNIQWTEDDEVAYTHNEATYSTFRLAIGRFHEIGMHQGKQIVIIADSGGAGLAFRDDDKETCLPVDIETVVNAWFDLRAIDQRAKLHSLIDQIDSFIDHFLKQSC